MKQIVLTFDDGPEPTTTPQILDSLKEQQVKATFMLWGEHVKAHPEIVKRAKQEGHAFGSHTYSHRSLLDLTDAEVVEEMARADEIILKTIGQKPEFCRPPYGDIDARVAKLLNRAAIIWSVDSRDWASHDEQQILARVKQYAHDGGIILMHDIQPATRDVLMCVIDYLKAANYEFVTIPELFQNKLKPMYSYYSTEKIHHLT